MIRWLAALLALAAVAALAAPDSAHAQVPDDYGTRDTSREFTAVASGSSATLEGIDVDDTHAYIANRTSAASGDYIRVFQLSDGARQTALEIPLPANVNRSPTGLAVDDTYVYVLDSSADDIFVYRKSTGVRQTDREFPLDSLNANPTGLAIDETYAYVVDGSDYHVYVYQLSGGDRVASREFGLAVLNVNPRGIALDDTYAYVMDWIDRRVYVYQLSDGDRVASREFDTVANVSLGGLTLREGLLYALGVVSPWQVYVYRVAGAPEAPSAPTLTADDARIVVSWTAPSDGGSAITGYDVQHRAGSSGAWTPWGHTGLATVTTITGLDNDQAYQVQVRAENDVGPGAWSAASTATPEPARTAPLAPGLPELTAGDASIAVSWTAPDDGNSPILSHQVRHRSTLGAQWTTRTVTRTRATISSLTAGQEYEVQVRAVNAIGEGTWSFSAVGSPQATGSVATLQLPLVALLRTPVELAVDYVGTPDSADTVDIVGGEVLNLSPDCDVAMATYTPPPTEVTLYPCAEGTGAVTFAYAGDGVTWSRSTQVVAPHYSYTVTVTSEAEDTLQEPTVTWRSLSWPLYRDGLISASSVVVIEGDEGERLRPLLYQEQGETPAAAEVLVCADGDTTCAGLSLWTSPEPQEGDRAYFFSDVPLALLQVTLDIEGERDTAWEVEWEYGTEDGWETLPNVQDGTEGLSKTGTVQWDAVTDMATRVVSPRASSEYVVRTTVTDAGAGTYQRPVIGSAGAQAGLWSATLQRDLESGVATILRVYVLPVDTVVVGDFRREGPPQTLLITPPAGLTAQVSPWRTWSAPVSPVTVLGPGVVGLPEGFVTPISGDAGLPLIGFAVERASAAAEVPTLVLWTMIGFGLAFVTMVAVQRKIGNILVTVAVGGLVLSVITVPSIGLAAVWVVFVYGVLGLAVVVIGERMQV